MMSVRFTNMIILNQLNFYGTATPEDSYETSGTQIISFIPEIFYCFAQLIHDL